MRTYLLCLLILSSASGYSQNLVPNSSFEDTTSCPQLLGQVSYADQWSDCGTNNTPDFFYSCSPAAVGIPDNIFGYQFAATGNGYCGFYTYYMGNDFREYISAQLITPMVIGQIYYVQFKVSRGDEAWIGAATDRIGARFTTNTCPLDSVFADNFAHVYTNTIITDTMGWTIISGSFIADSAYQYIRLGNFFDDASTNSTATSSVGYYYIDDVCVSTDSATCVGLNAIDRVDPPVTINIFPNPTEGQTVIQINKPVQNATLSVTNILGETVFEIQNVSDQKIVITLDFLPAGLYFLRLVENREVLVIEKLMIRE